MPVSIAVLIVGEERETRRWCAERLARQVDLRVVGEAATADEVARWAELERGVVVVVGRRAAALPALVRAARQHLAGCSVLLVGPPPALLTPGVAGWLALESPVDLGAAVVVAATGGRVSDRVVVAREAAPAFLAELTARETQVLRLLSRGLTNPAIGDELRISTDTVKSHVRHIMRKLRVRDRTQAAVIATRARIA